MFKKQLLLFIILITSDFARIKKRFREDNQGMEEVIILFRIRLIRKIKNLQIISKSNLLIKDV